MTQLQIHKRINEFFKTGVVLATIQVAQELISYNADAKWYFFSQANEEWVDWLWKNGFFEILKKKTSDITKYSYNLPELQYLTLVAEKKASAVADIIISTPISPDTFNPEVVDRFFWITGQLPPEQIKRVLPNILSQNWIQLMAPFGRSGYEFKLMVEKLVKAEDYATLIILAEIILTVRRKEEFADKDRFSISDRLFYLRDITETGILEAITSKSSKSEDALGVLIKVFSKIVDLGKEREETIFKYTEPFYLLDVDIFTLELDTNKRSYHREDIQNLVASCKTLFRQILDVCEQPTDARRIYEKHILTLPDSHTGWRLKLYALTRCPEIFKKELEEALFRVFVIGDRYFELEGGAEYHQTLKIVFGLLDKDTTQREYVKAVFEYFAAELEDKDRVEWRKRDGLEILTYIKNYLTPEEITKAELLFGKFPEEGQLTPHPSIGKIISGSVSYKSPFDISSLSIDQLIEKLKTDGNPKNLKEKYINVSILEERGPEGLSEAIKEDFKKRRQEYINNLNKFFERDVLHSTYVYAILRQIEELFRAKESFTNEEYQKILDFFFVIEKSGRVFEFKKSEEKDFRLADWITVHQTIADVLLDILVRIKDSQLFKDNRDKILLFIKYLLSVKSSPDIADDKREADNPANVAINSVRGEAFRAFVQFTYNESNDNLSTEVMEFYEFLLDTESSNAVRFTIGQFLASFFYRNEEFTKKLLPKIFPKEDEKRDIYFATWEGYLSVSLYKELYEALKDEYEYATKIDSKIYPDRKYLKGLDESLAVHLALAYEYFDFKMGDPLFDLFWSTPNEIRHYEFISHIGRSCITRSGAGDEWFKDNKVDKTKLITFWDWAVSTKLVIEPKAFSGFGFWINPDKEVIDENFIITHLPATIEKSKGELDWDYGLTRKITTFAKLNPKNTLEVIRHFLLLDGKLNPNRRSPLFSLEHEIKEALVIIYKDESLKADVTNLINTLITEGSTPFWTLKEVLK